ncbi:phosphonate ABC transporter ATP-binding protein [Streptomyces zagrosensis]|uniref:Phosphonate transport system ATP-binding protein n=1 Tax=Streptomyces zagrosensis TaxID=1042984 RepID=A0A7W9UYB4_9ACTN|nr:phosphonate ABC transporter ATP-binding protein [Streptomyces zagrosensis]MBB5935477.1 phosphonate transport system ATP-binding protein [Streptomyces zagrosensis]
MADASTRTSAAAATTAGSAQAASLAGHTAQAGRTGHTEQSVPTGQAGQVGRTGGAARRAAVASAPVDDEIVVRIDSLTKRFGSGSVALTALDEVSFDVRRGEVVALLGLSGSGKSTLLQHIDGLQTPSAGGGTVLGTNLATAGRAELRALRRRIGFVFQQFHLIGRLTVLENVCTGALGSLRGPRLGLFSYPRAIRERALDHLERVGLADWAFQRADTLSGGQQQRVGVARALMQEPTILLADEPVASLDPESSGQIMRLLREVADQNQLTVLCSLHQVDLALSWADRIVGLREGRVVMDVPTKGIGRDAVMRLYARVGAGPVSGANPGPEPHAGAAAVLAVGAG